ncbi:MAG: helix-turn-helix domain-containing protein, partial [Caldivirga sp.]
RNKRKSNKSKGKENRRNRGSGKGNEEGNRNNTNKGRGKNNKKANKLGYFNDDRRVTLRQVAEELGLSTTTVSRQIQSGIRKIVRLMLSDNEIDY